MLSGIPRSFCTLSIALVASPREAPGARLKEIVTTGNWPWWLMESGALADSKCVNVPSGTAAPLIAVTAEGVAEPDVAVGAGPAGPLPVDALVVSSPELDEVD